MVVAVEVVAHLHLLEQVVEQEQMLLGLVVAVAVEDQYLLHLELVVMVAMAHPVL
jgi:hypothetical protein